MPAPTVSVIIPVYNREAYIAETIESVLKQTFDDFELIIINDGSTDKSGEVIRGFTDSRITYIEQPNKGLAPTWNVGIEIAKGQYVKLLDSDDIIDPAFLEESIRAASENPRADIIHSNWHYINEYGKVLSPYKLGRIDDILYILLLGNIFGVHEILFKKEALDAVGHFDSSIRICEDWDLYIRLARARRVFLHLDKYLSSHRVHEGTYKKAVVDRFRQVLDKTFSDETLEPHYMECKYISEARHALFLLRDMVKWRWLEEADGCLRRLSNALSLIRSRNNIRRDYLNLILPIWPVDIGMHRYFTDYRRKLVMYGAGYRCVLKIDLMMFRHTLNGLLRIAD